MRLESDGNNKHFTIRYSDAHQNFTMGFESLEQAKPHANALKCKVWFKRQVVYEPLINKSKERK